MNKNVIGKIILQDKEKIIKMYDCDRIDILDIAEKYNIRAGTMCQKLRKWGVRIRKGDYVKHKSAVEVKVKRSKELQAKIDYNTKINNERIKFY